MKKMMKRGLSLMTCAAILAGLLSSCGSGSAASETEASGGKAGKLTRAARKESQSTALPEAVYQRFLEGSGTASAGENITSFSGGEYTLDEILSCVETAFQYWSMSSVSYAMIDCGQDGVPELALQLTFQDPYGWQIARDYLVFKAYDGELQCIKEFGSYYRDEAWLNQAGVIQSVLMLDYSSYATEERFLDGEGKESFVYGCQSRNGLEINLIPEELLPERLRDSLKISHSSATYNEDGYCLNIYYLEDAEDADGHYVFSDAAGLDGMPEDEILSIYQKNGLQIHGVEEEEALLAEHKRSLGLTEEMENAEEPAWTVLRSETTEDSETAAEVESAQAAEPETAYAANPDSFILRLQDPMQADVLNDGNPLTLGITAIPKEGYDAAAIDIVLKDGDTVKASETFDKWSYVIDSYYVKQGDRHFLYVFGTYENDYTLLDVFELTDAVIRKAGELPLFPYDEGAALQDPEHLYLSTSFDVINSCVGSRMYRVGADGMPESDALYEISGYADEPPLIPRKAISAWETDAAGNRTGNEVVLQPSDRLFVHMTDDDHRVIFAYGSGQYAEVSAKLHSYPQLINGEDVETVLEGIRLTG